MNLEEAAIVHQACADAIRLLHDIGDALAAVSVATRMVVEATERIEHDLVAIASLADVGDRE